MTLPFPFRRKPKPPPEKPLVLFKRDDRVVLKDKNPYKGSLRGGTVYTVLDCSPSWVMLSTDVGVGPYKSECFKLIEYDDTAADMYDEAMAAQDIMEKL